MATIYPQLRTAYHNVIKSEVKKYNRIKNLKDLFLEKNEIENAIGDPAILEELIRKGYVLEFKVDGRELYRSMHMDIAVRAAYGVKPMKNVSGRVMEKDILIKEEPVLERDYLKFLNEKNKPYLELKKVVEELIGPKKAEAFFKGLYDAEITGLTVYQYEAIMRLLNSKPEERFFLVSAPTGFGKTYVYLLTVIIELLREKENGVKAVFFYPRKSLEADQMSEIVKILYHINENLQRLGMKPIRVGIYDKNTPWNQENVQDGEEFRGVVLKITGREEKLFLKKKEGKVILTSESGVVFNWIPVLKSEIANNPPDLIITNLWSYVHAMINRDRWKSNYVNPETVWFVFDEVHVYRENIAGVLRYILRILSIDVAPKAKFVLSSATIPNAEEFMRDLGIENYVDLTFREDDYREHVKERKLNIYLMLALRPDSSWETFAHELGLFLSTIATLRESGPQSIIFIDSIREIERIRNQLEVAAERGKITSHFFDKSKKKKKEPVEPTDPYSLVPYGIPKDFERFKKAVLDNIDYHYADSPLRHEVEEKLKKGQVKVAYATSTLELGVNYKNVSIVVNLGIPRSVESIVQRMGRAGRDPDKTLYTALGIVIVRPTPMEYYYAYKGLNEIINYQNSRIPVAYNNHFVILFSALLRTMIIGVKSNEEYTTNKTVPKMIGLLRKIWGEYKTKRVEILKGLGINPENELRIENLVENLIETLANLEPKRVEARCQRMRLIAEVSNAISRIEEKIERVVELLDEIEMKINEPEKKYQLSNSYLRNLKTQENIEKSREIISNWERLRKAVENEEISDIITTGMEAESILDELNAKLGSVKSDLNKIRNALWRLNSDEAKNIGELKEELEITIERINKIKRERIGKIINELEESPKKDIGPFTCEVLKYLNDIQNNLDLYPRINGLNLVETILGIKFLGNEFLDKNIETGIWIPGKWNGRDYKHVDLGEYSFSSVVFRTPPFELGTIPWEDKNGRKITDKIGGRYVWLLYPEDGIEFYRKSGKDWEELKDILEKYRIGVGVSKHMGSFYDVSRVDYIDVLALDEPIILRIEVPDSARELWLKYGSKRAPKYDIPQTVKKLHELKSGEALLQNILDKLDEMNVTLKRDSAGIKFNYIRYCELGRAMSTDPTDYTCPFQDKCSMYKKGKNYDKCIHWISWKRRTFPKVYLKKRVKLPKVIERNIGEKLMGAMSIGSVHYYELSETPAHFIYDTVTIYVPTGPIESIERSFQVYPLGYDAITSMIVLAFNPKLLEIIIRWIYKHRPETLKAMLYKYAIYRLVKGGGLFSLYIDAINREMERVADLKTIDWEDFTRNDKKIKDFLRFSVKVLLHSMAHRFIVHLVRRYGFDENKLTYLVNESEGKVYIVENSKNDGIGIVETFSSNVKERGEGAVLREFLLETLDFFKKHEESVREEMLRFSIEASDIVMNPEGRELLEKIETLNEELKNAHIEPEKMDYITYRFLLKDHVREEEGELIGSVLDYRRTPHLCYDGCNLCLYFGRDCTEGTVQHYTLSKRLLSDFAEIVLNGCITFENVKMFETMLLNVAKGAKNASIDVAFVDEKGLEILETLKEEGVKITITTKGNDWDRTIIEKLKKLLGDENVSRITRAYHKKVYTLTYNGALKEIVIAGSPNLTRNSLEENRENVTLLFNLGG